MVEELVKNTGSRIMEAKGNSADEEHYKIGA